VTQERRGPKEKAGQGRTCASMQNMVATVLNSTRQIKASIVNLLG